MNEISVVYRPGRAIGWDPGLLERYVSSEIGTEPAPRRDISGTSAAEKLAEAIVGTGRDRPGKKPPEENLRLIRNRIDRFVREDRPIEARFVWVPKKRGRIGEEASADLSEMFSLLRLASLDRQVRRIYPRGLHFNVFFLDFEGLYIEGDRPEIREAMDGYCGELQRLVCAAGWDGVISLIRVSETAGEKERAEWTSRLRENYEKLLAYWNESEEKGIDGHETYASYAELLKIGWIGALPAEARAYFLERIDGLAPSLTLEDRRGFVLRNFSASLLHHQVMILKTPGGAPLNLSFTPPAPKIPGHLLKARIDLRPFPHGVGCTSAPPWADKAWIEWVNGRPAVMIKGWRESLPLHERMISGVLEMTGRGRCARIRADYLPAERPGNR